MTKEEFLIISEFFISHGAYAIRWNWDLKKDVPTYNPNKIIKIRMQSIIQFLKCLLDEADQKEIFPND